MRRLFLLFSTFALAAGATSAEASRCARVLVSGYYSTVHIYDGCSGAPLGQLDARSRLTGAQAIRRHQGELYVIAEGRGVVERYREDTLGHVDTPFVSTAAAGITGIDLAADGRAYVGRYNTSDVIRFNAPGAEPSVVVPAGSSGLAGTDNGVILGPDGLLYVPGFDSGSVVRFNPTTGLTTAFIAAGSGGLARTRAILFDEDSGLLVTSEGSHQVLRYHSDGSFDRVFAELGAGFRPTGIDRLDAQTLLVASFGSNRVVRVDARTGVILGDLVAGGAGGLRGATFVAVLPAEQPIDTAQIGSQYWVVGAGLAATTLLEVDDMQSATGSAFGDLFEPSEIQRKRWGRIRIEFIDCQRGHFSWESDSADGAGFGSGSYPIQRMLPTAAGDRCEAQGLSSMTDAGWMAGVWYGGAERSGEGLFIDVSSAGPASVAFFTHRPAAR